MIISLALEDLFCLNWNRFPQYYDQNLPYPTESSDLSDLVSAYTSRWVQATQAAKYQYHYC